MHPPRRRALLALAALAAPLPAVAQPAPPAAAVAAAFPTKTVRIVVPFPAGGTADVLPRIVAEKLSARWGQPVIVENRPGAGGNLGAEAVARAEPDGHTLLASPPGPLAINQSLYAKLPYDATRFVPISILATVPNVLAVRNGLPAGSLAELLAQARANPGKLTYASQGNGSTSHLTANLLQAMGGIQMLHVPYKGTAPALTDLIGGQIDLFFDNLSSSLGHARSGKLKILAVAGPRRNALLPDVPTMAEAGLPGFQSVTWFGVAAPPGTPEPVARQIAAAIDEALKAPDVQKRFAEQAAEPVGGTPAETGAFIRDEAARWKKVIATAKVTLD